MAVRSRLTQVKRVPRGAAVSYGGHMVWSPGIEIQEYKCEPEDG